MVSGTDVALVDRHGKDRLVIGQPVGIEPPHRPVGGREEDPEGAGAFRVGQRDADIAVEEPQAVIVAGHHDGAPLVPGPARRDVPLAGQDPLDGGIQGARPVRAVPQGAEDAKAAEAFQDGSRRLCSPVIPAARKDNPSQGPRQIPRPRDPSPSEIPVALCAQDDRAPRLLPLP